MKNSMSRWQLAGFFFTSIAGILLHFLYEWTNQSIFVAPFSAVNESTWEHMKLLFFPMFLFALVQRFFMPNVPDNFWYVKLAGILLGLILIPTTYYTYTGISGTSLDWINIGIFFITVAITYLFETRLFRHNTFACKGPLFALLILCLIALTFIILTFVPPKIPLFEPPLN